MLEIHYLQEGVEGSANLKLLFNFLNNKYFGGSLPKIPIKWNGKLKNAIGRAHVKYKGTAFKHPFAKYLEEIPVQEKIELDYSSLKIDISSKVDLSLKDLQAVMIHEMVHVELYLKKKIGGHHDSPEFQNRIKKLSGESGLNIPLRESDFKASPKLEAKEGYVLLVWYGRNEVGASSYTENFIKKNWLVFAQKITRITGYSSKINRVEAYKVKHTIFSEVKAKRSLSSMEWRPIDETVAKEIQRGKKFFSADKGGGMMEPHKAISGIKELAKNARLEFNKQGEWTNASETHK
jgi:hypothetical protein